MATLEQQLKELIIKIKASRFEKMVKVRYVRGRYAGTKHDLVDTIRENKAKRLVKQGKAEIVKPENKGVNK